MNEILEFVVRHGAAVLFAAVFVEQVGVPLPAAPWLLAAGALAGVSGIRAPRFFFFDGLGSMLYGGSFILVGALFSHQLEQVIAALASLGSGALGVVAGLVALYIGYKYFQRRRLLNELRMARITVDELHQKLEAGENPIILDLRSVAEVERNPLLIRGARHMTMDEVQLRQNEIPRDRDIILYCS